MSHILRDASGWTFVETLVVIVIVLMLTGTATLAGGRLLDRAAVATAQTQISTLVIGLDSYYMDNRRYPTGDQGLEALWSVPTLTPVPQRWNGPYLNRPLPVDPWGTQYEYLVPGPNGLPYSIRSYGADGRLNGVGVDADITSW